MTRSDYITDSAPNPSQVSDVVIVALEALVRTNVALEHLLFRISSKPGRTALRKGQDPDALSADATEFAQSLLLDTDVLAFLEHLRAAGKKIVITSDLPKDVLVAVTARVGDTTQAFSTQDAGDPTQKVQQLIHAFGADFTFIGTNAHHAAFWKASGGGVTVRANANVRQIAEGAAPQVHHLIPTDHARAPWRACFHSLRPHQWLKNLLVYLPLLGAAETDLRLWATAIYAFIAFCLTASSVYVINDLVDLAADRAHKRKRNRPFAAGVVPLDVGLIMAAVLLMVAFSLAAAMTNWVFVLVLAGYFAMTLAYSLVLKRELVVDIITLGGLYSIRIIGGGVATQAELSPWMLAFSGFFFLSLAAVKRQAELFDLASRGRQVAAGRAYRSTDLPIVAMMAIAAGYTAVLILALFLSSEDVQALYVSPKFLLLICPVLLFWISRVIMLTHRGQMTDDPVVFATRDIVSWLCIVVSLGVTLIARTL